VEKALALAAALAGASVAPQEPAQAPAQEAAQGQAVFRSAVTVRSVFVSVFDKKGRPVEGLTKEDFALAESGAAREIAHIAPAAGVPLDAVLLVDASGSMAIGNRAGGSGAVVTRMDFAKAAALDFVGALRPQDRAAVVPFSSSLPEELPALVADKAALAAAVGAAKAYGGTPLYDAISLALKGLPEASGRQRSIVILSDGEDTNSYSTYAEVLSLARESTASVYAVVAEERNMSKEQAQNMAELGRLAEETGGRLERVKDMSRLPDVYARIAAELAGKYQLGFYPGDESGRPPVSVTLPKRRGLSVRSTRPSPL